MRRLIEAGRALVAELDPAAVLERVLVEARKITGARYAALGVLDEDRRRLQQFLTSGIDEETQLAIGDLPSGRGVLGVLIEEPQVLRLSDVGSHPASYGFPPGHPPMRTFLGAPIVVRGTAWGNLYLSEKEGGKEFSPEDEDAVSILAHWAATAIDNARLFDDSERRREEAEHAVRSLRAARDIADAIGGTSDLEGVLELIVKRGRALVDAQTILILLREGDDLVVAASAGRARGAAGHRIPIAGSTSGHVLEHGQPVRISDVEAQLRISPTAMGVEGAHTALLVPMMHRGSGLGVLTAFDRGGAGGSFSAVDEQVLRTFTSSAANAVAIKRSVEADRLRWAIAAADAERGRWARELHDETLQALGGLRVLLVSAQKGLTGPGKAQIGQAIEDVEVEIDNLRSIITDLRPSVLDDLGLLAAIEALLQRRRDTGLEIQSELLEAAELKALELTPDLEMSVYRFVQEALTNIAKHSEAQNAQVSLRIEEGELVAEVTDDGAGFDAEAATSGFGLAGMRERIYLAGGEMVVDSRPGEGTTVTARVPVGSQGAAVTDGPPSRLAG